MEREQDKKALKKTLFLLLIFDAVIVIPFLLYLPLDWASTAAWIIIISILVWLFGSSALSHLEEQRQQRLTRQKQTSHLLGPTYKKQSSKEPKVIMEWAKVVIISWKDFARRQPTKAIFVKVGVVVNLLLVSWVLLTRHKNQTLFDALTRGFPIATVIASRSMFPIMIAERFWADRDRKSVTHEWKYVNDRGLYGGRYKDATIQEAYDHSHEGGAFHRFAEGLRSNVPKRVNQIIVTAVFVPIVYLWFRGTGTVPLLISLSVLLVDAFFIGKGMAQVGNFACKNYLPSWKLSLILRKLSLIWVLCVVIVAAIIFAWR